MASSKKKRKKPTGGRKRNNVKHVHRPVKTEKRGAAGKNNGSGSRGRSDLGQWVREKSKRQKKGKSMAAAHTGNGGKEVET